MAVSEVNYSSATSPEEFSITVNSLPESSDLCGWCVVYTDS